jgi:hypothetical protein
MNAPSADHDSPGHSRIEGTFGSSPFSLATTRTTRPLHDLKRLCPRHIVRTRKRHYQVGVPFRGNCDTRIRPDQQTQDEPDRKHSSLAMPAISAAEPATPSGPPLTPTANRAPRHDTTRSAEHLPVSAGASAPRPSDRLPRRTRSDDPAKAKLWAAEVALRELGHQPSPLDALGGPRAARRRAAGPREAAAVRWHGRLELEAPTLTLIESQLALAALASFCAGERDAVDILRRLLKAG